MSVFQLSVLSQDDPQCPVGSSLSVVVDQPVGGTLASNSFPIGTAVALPTPPGTSTYGPTPTWFLDLSNGIDAASFTLTISGPSPQITTPITIPGDQMAAWVAQNNIEDTNQIWQPGECGIFGYAQYNADADQWIYTVTAGVYYPQVNPPV
ncbi:MAG TPA: hypothetical protein VF006_26475 [Longimicrobium sp.]